MTMLRDAWDNVTPEIIINCFRHAHISSATQTAAESDLDDPFASLAESLGELQERDSSAVPVGLSAQNFISFDTAVATSATLVLSDDDDLAFFQ